MNILFIVDGSITNPILQSQGFPLLDYVGSKNFKSIILSSEKKGRHLNEKEILRLKRKYPNITFYSFYEKRSKIFPNWLPNIFLTIYKTRKIIKINHIDIIHCRSLSPSIIGLLFKMISKRRLKLLYDNRGVRIEEEIKIGHWKRKGIKVYLFSWLEKKIIQSADIIVVVSEQFKSYMINQYYKNNIDIDKIIIIPNRTKIDHKMNLEFKRNFKTPICVYSGSAAIWQSLKEIKAIIVEAIKIYNQIKFQILTYHPAQFENIFSNDPHLKEFVCIKQINHEEVYAELINCNFSLLIRENDLINNVASPLKFAEYLAAGLPILISEGVGDTEEIVTRNNIGVVIRNKNYNAALEEMKILLDDPNIYTRCRKVAEKEFDLETTFKQYLNIYKNISE